MKHLTSLCQGVLLCCIATTTIPTLAAAEPRGFYATVYAQVSQLDSANFDESGNAGFGSGLTAKFNSGFGLGGDIGFRYGNGWAAEVEWNYRRHNLDTLRRGATTLADGGDFASNILFLNGLRRFPGSSGTWTPYIGAGLGWVQEIDFDLNSSGSERAWSKQGRFGIQLIGGAEIPLNKNWRMAADVRVLRLGGVELSAEENVIGKLSKPNYNPVSVQIGLRRAF
jgi:opacity protein-like surface antigen